MKLKLFLATALLVTAAAVTASADAPTVSTPTSDGFGEISTTETDSSAMMAVNAGDTIEFTVTGATGDVTLLSAKQGVYAGSDTIQYVNQYDAATLAAADNTISYTVRNLEEQNGIYYLKLNDGTTTHTYYYKYGRPELIAGEGVEESATYYVKAYFDKNGKKSTEEATDKYALGYVATFNLNGAAVDEYGFTLKKINSDSPDQSSGAKAESEITGSGSFAFGVTVYDIPDEKTINEFKVEPFVTYKADTTSSEG